MIQPFHTIVPTAEDLIERTYSPHGANSGNTASHILLVYWSREARPDISRVRLPRIGVVERYLVVNAWAAHEWYGRSWDSLVGER